jgi:hypothetical protein
MTQTRKMNSGELHCCIAVETVNHAVCTQSNKMRNASLYVNTLICFRFLSIVVSFVTPCIQCNRSNEYTNATRHSVYVYLSSFCFSLFSDGLIESDLDNSASCWEGCCLYLWCCCVCCLFHGRARGAIREKYGIAGDSVRSTQTNTPRLRVCFVFTTLFSVFCKSSRINLQYFAVVAVP